MRLGGSLLQPRLRGPHGPADALLRRRGWTAESLKVAQMVTIDGWPARDGSRYLRVRRVVALEHRRPRAMSDGTVLGAPPNQRAD